MDITKTFFSKGLVEFVEFPGWALKDLKTARRHDEFQDLIDRLATKRFRKGNLVFNYPREQYAKLDRGDEPESINARYLTLSNDVYTNPATLTVTGETLRLSETTQAVDPANPNNSIIRFIIEPGQFIGSWQTAILIGGPTATSTPGTGKIVAAVNNVKDDTNNTLNRDGSETHLVNWKLKHLDSSEV